MKKFFLTVIVLALALSLSACRQEPDRKPPEAGYYILSSVSSGEVLSFFGTPDPSNGYVLLEDDHTGRMLWNGTEQELELEAAMLVLIFEEEQTTAIFRSGDF